MKVISTIDELRSYFESLGSEKVEPVLWMRDEKLYSAIEKATENVNNDYKSLAKACKYMKFKDHVFVDNKSDNKTILSLKAFDEEFANNFDKINENVRFIVSSNDSEEIFVITQNLIYIDLPLSVFKEEDTYKKIAIENIKQRKDELINSTKILKDIIDKSFKEAEDKQRDNIDKEQVKNLRSRLIELAENILTNLSNIENKVIKVGVFATKKSGKSMVVNALLGEEYAPTSLELPTPNIIRYIPSDKKEIRLEYANNTIQFSSPQELRKFINNEFQKVKEFGGKLDDMIVYYPKKEGVNYEVYDTPGPDLAGSQHDMIDKILPEVDVAVFVIDYSKYAQTSEIELLEKIKKYFEETGREYSFIVAVNKIDLMFGDSNTEKIKCRVADFIHEKLITLGFKKFIVIPISARTYFYMHKLVSKFPDIRSSNVIDYLGNIEIRKKIRSIKEEDYNTYGSTISNIVNDLSWLFDKEDISYDEIINFSGFEAFNKYIIHIAEEKAELERLWHIVEELDRDISALATIINSRLIEEESKIKEISKILDDIREKIEKEAKDKQKDAKIKIYDKKRDILKTIKGKIDYAVKTMEDKSDFEVANKIKSAMNNAVKEIRRNAELFETWQIDTYSFISIVKNLGKQVFQIDFSEELESIKKAIAIVVSFQALEDYLNKIMLELQNDIKKIVEDANKAIDKELSIPNLIQVSDIVLEADFARFAEKIERLQEKANQSLETNAQVSAAQVSPYVLGRDWPSFWPRGYIRSVDTDKIIEEFESSIKVALDEAKENIINVLKKDLKDIFNDIRDYLDELADDNLKKLDEFLDYVTKTLADLRNILNMENQNRKMVFGVLNKVYESFEPIKIIWKDDIIKAYKEYMSKKS